jgi:hypothetical protein
MKPNKITSVQLKPVDYPCRIVYCQWIVHHMNGNRILDLFFFTDEVCFHLSGYVNSQSCRIWSTEYEFEEIHSHSVKEH